MPEADSKVFSRHELEIELRLSQLGQSTTMILDEVRNMQADIKKLSLDLGARLTDLENFRGAVEKQQAYQKGVIAAAAAVGAVVVELIRRFLS